MSMLVGQRVAGALPRVSTITARVTVTRAVSLRACSAADIEAWQDRLQQIRNQPAPTWLRVPHRAVLAVRGPEALTFLQGLTTQDLLPQEPEEPFELAEDDADTADTAADSSTAAATHPTKPLHTMFLHAKGRILCDALAYPTLPTEPRGFYFEVDADMLAPLHKHLRSFKLRTKVSFDALAPDVIGDPGRTLAALIVPCTLEPVLSNDDGSIYAYLRLALGLSEGPQDHIDNKSLPLEANIEHWNGVSFKKGCYLGQELTARTHYSGMLRKRLLPMRIPDVQAAVRLSHYNGPLKVVTAAGKPAGTVHSVLGDRCIGLVRTAHLTEELVLQPPADAEGADAIDPVVAVVDHALAEWISATRHGH
ncbi:uncharacterized protein MONBRDRAFT_24953 [Monosiga brevicollis MX1]|uniref:CAF17 C-terminal domain-containing protein n=1 Tax=Monosiga brevicollis TaxID=81824 RepID=A9UY85_MONBE|nr:uncharacterized protein MONBRDRAFT_24953 [Monosiga brevicollis MX1]EDQ89813.1 predicted protein [Monosiga brevicollis MX1]|eukprot:XP_001745235.1 hypothetical protein [Monosiga brevicollis MX1]